MAIRNQGEIPSENIDYEDSEIRTIVDPNHMDVSYTEDVSSIDTTQWQRILIVEAMRRKDTMKFDTRMIGAVKTHIAFWKKKHPEAKVEHFFQLKKGEKRTDTQLQAIQDAQEGADARLFYEKWAGQDEEALSKQLESYKAIYPDGKHYVVLEVEGPKITSKVVKAIGKGFYNFVLVGGEYGNLPLWKQLVNLIRTEKGTSIAIPYTRMNSHTRESKAKFFICAGVDYVIHGIPNGGPIKEVLYLDPEDLFFKPITKTTDEETLSLVRTCPKDKLYPLSRALAHKKANAFAQAYEAQPVIEQ